MSAANLKSTKTNTPSGFYQFLNKTNDMAIVIDHKLNILYKNPKAEVRISGDKLQSVISYNHKKEFGLLLNKIIVKKIDACQIRLLFVDGIWYECQLTNLIDDDEVKGIVCTMKEDVNNNHLSDEQPGTEHFYRIITDNLPAMIAYWTADLRCLFANKAYLLFFDKTESEMYNTKIDKLYTRDQISKHERFMKEALKGNAQRFERTIETEGREDRIILTEYVPDVEDEHIMGFYTLIYDITDLKTTERELAIRNKEMGDILGRITDGFISLDKNNNYTYANQQIGELLDIPAADLLGKNIWELFPEYIGSELYHTINSCRRSGHHAVIEDYFAPRDLWDECRIYPSESGVSIFVRDITRQKKEEDRLKLMESVITNTSDAIMITNNRIKSEAGPAILYVNEAFRKLTGYSDEDIMTETVAILHGPKTDLLQLDRLLELTANQGSGKMTILLYTKQGKPYWADLSVNPVINSVGEHTHVIVIHRDVSARVQREERELLNNKISAIFSKGEDLGAVLSDVLGKLVEYGDFLIAEVWLAGTDKKSLSLAAHFASTDTAEGFYDDNKDFKIGIDGEGFVRNIWKTGSPQHLIHLEKHSFFLRKDAAKIAGLKSVYGVPLIDNTGSVLGVMMIGMDNNNLPDQHFISLVESISTHFTVEIVRKRLELELEQIFNCAPDVIVIAGTDGFYKKINPAMVALLGFSELELLNRHFITFIHPEDLDYTLHAFKEVTEGKALRYFENRLMKKDGAYIWLAWNVTPATENGLIFCVGKDITERKNDEQELITLNQKLEQQNKQLKDISWIQSHMVRAPIARILGIINIIDLGGSHLNDELKEMLHFLKNSALELDEVIVKITELSNAKQKN